MTCSLCRFIDSEEQCSAMEKRIQPSDHDNVPMINNIVMFISDCSRVLN